MWVNCSCIKGTFLWFIYKNGKQPKIKSCCKCSGRKQHWETREGWKRKVMALRVRSRNLPVRSWDLRWSWRTSPALSRWHAQRSGTGWWERNVWIAFLGRHFFPYYSVAAWLSPAKCQPKFISDPARLKEPFGDDRAAEVESAQSLARAARCDAARDQRNSAGLLGARLRRPKGLFKKKPQLVTRTVLTRSHRETKRYDASITKSLFKAEINFWH